MGKSLFNFMLVCVVSIGIVLTPQAFAGNNNLAGIKVNKAQFNKKHNRLDVKGRVGNDSSGDEVTLWDADLNTMLASGVTKKDKFKFKYALSEGDIVPCRIEVRVAGESSSRKVKRAPQDCGQYQVTITGLVTDSPIPFATVTVTLNGNTYTTVADENGAFSLDILTVSLDELVTIESSATDAETGDPINFVNMAGTFSKLLSDPEANVTNVTTASYILAVEANGGVAPNNIEELTAAETSIDASTLLELAAVIKLVVDDPRFELPDGFDSLIDFVANDSAVESFIEDVAAIDPQALENTQSEILNDTSLVAGFTVDEIPARYYVIAAAEPGYMARSGAALEFDGSTGTGQYLSFAGWNGQAINQTYSWAVVGGRLELNYDSPQAVALLTSHIEDLTDDQSKIDAYYAGGGVHDNIVYESSEVQRKYTRVVDGNLVDMISTEVKTVLHTPPFELVDGSMLELEVDKLDISTSNQSFRSSLDIQNIPFTTSCLTGEVCALGNWGGVFHYAAGTRVYDDYIYPTSSYGELLTFNNDTSVSGAISGESASWNIDSEGKLIIDYADGTVQTLQIIDNIGLEYGVFSIFENGGERYADYNLWVRGDSQFSLSGSYLTPSASNRYWNGEINSWIPGGFDANGVRLPSNRFGWKFDGAGGLDNYWVDQNRDYDGDGNNDLGLIVTATHGWEVDAGIARLDRFSFARRYWFPVASTDIDGQRVFYVIEREARDYGQGWKTFIPARMNIQREIDEFTDWDYIEQVDAQ
ncbi:carboxypeptidase-like regulatory domain-containing protein [Shewanella sp. UCD-KL12]|uniref:carboxypeptidase-like regulatory domain-containing protein n=1 Tax=Shewanella sp. UCD-KL12 TaxID=1917163 RepID=UPI0009F9FF1F|nr:carboxypeptidase-like regulatory domain-containing protein [Shewanella sp. UCD-KL12]